MKNQSISLLLGCLALLGALHSAQAQWVTQHFDLKPGWNAVYLNVDPSHVTLQQLITAAPGNPIDEVWLWRTAISEAQFVTSPQVPTDEVTPWVSWFRNLGPSSSLQRMIGNTAYLVHVPTNQPAFGWDIKGKPVPPDNSWTVTGLNFIGFPSARTNPPSFETFLGKSPLFQQAAEIFYYPGGELGSNNPARLFSTRTKRVNRGEAFWIRSGALFNKYFSPFDIALQNSAGIVFGDKVGAYRVRLRNLISENVTVRLELAASETAPAGQPAIIGLIPMILRGDLNPTNITYGVSNLAGAPVLCALAPAGQVGSEKEVILGVNRFAMAGNPGAVFAGVLRFTDSLGFSQIDVPANASVASSAGLWVGNASVTHVRQYLKKFEKDTNGTPVMDADGKYILTGLDTSFGKTPRPYDLRLVMHRDNSGANVLLQRVYYGMGVASNLVVATKESLLHPGHLDAARRITAVHLPWSAANTPWTCTGELRPGTNLTAVVYVPHGDQAANPFLHTYHPDHDNLKADYKGEEDQGVESYSIRRTISLSLTPPGLDFDALTTSGEVMVGSYEESMTLGGLGTQTRQFDTAGVFLLRKLSPVPTLSQ